MIYNLYKQRGETPLECIERFRKTNPNLENIKMTYLGRLDPLAEGVLLMASGEDVKRKEEFLGLDKEYEFTALFGFATDSYDILGKVLKIADFAKGFVVPKEMDLIKICKIYEGEREQKYPKYSSKMIALGFPSPEQGEGRVGFSKKITIHKLQFHKLETHNSKELFGRLLMNISKVKGNFRQHEILTLWKQILFGSGFPSPDQGEGHTKWGVGYFSAHVSSGTYIRSLVNDMGNTLGCGATTLSIKRTRVGDFKIEESQQFF